MFSIARPLESPQLFTPAQEGTSTPRQWASLVVGLQTDSTFHRKGHPGKTILPPPDTQSINDEHVTGPSVPTREMTNGTQDRGGDLTVNQG